MTCENPPVFPRQDLFVQHAQYKINLTNNVKQTGVNPWGLGPMNFLKPSNHFWWSGSFLFSICLPEFYNDKAPSRRDQHMPTLLFFLHHGQLWWRNLWPEFLTVDFNVSRWHVMWMETCESALVQTCLLSGPKKPSSRVRTYLIPRHFSRWCSFCPGGICEIS